jgi:hypothetical protein
VGGYRLGAGGEMTQTMYAHVNNELKKKRLNRKKIFIRKKKITSF